MTSDQAPSQHEMTTIPDMAEAREPGSNSTTLRNDPVGDMLCWRAHRSPQSEWPQERLPDGPLDGLFERQGFTKDRELESDTDRQDNQAPLWFEVESINTMTSAGVDVNPKIRKSTWGYFLDHDSAQYSNCYRRSTFSLVCTLDLQPNVASDTVRVQQDESTAQILGFGVKLSASSSRSLAIGLIQKKLKRQKVADVNTILPICATQDRAITAANSAKSSAVPYRPVDHKTYADINEFTPGIASEATTSVMGGIQTKAIFERVQFDRPTEGNKRRRGTQEFFHLNLELFASIQEHDGAEVTWVQVAKQVSHDILVRGGPTRQSRKRKFNMNDDDES